MPRGECLVLLTYGVGLDTGKPQSSCSGFKIQYLASKYYLLLVATSSKHFSCLCNILNPYYGVAGRIWEKNAERRETRKKRIQWKHTAKITGVPDCFPYIY